MAEQRKLSIFGVGPVFVLVSLAFTAAGLSARLLWPDAMTIRVCRGDLLMVVGLGLVAIGSVFFLWAGRTLVHNFAADTATLQPQRAISESFVELGALTAC